MEPRKSARSFAVRMAEATAASRAAGHEVVAWRAGNVPKAIAFYSGGAYVVESDDPDVLVEHLRSDAPVYAVVDAADLDELPADALDGISVIHEQRLSRRKLQIIGNRAAGRR